MMQTIDILTELLNENKIKYWIDQGTLLFLIRDGILKQNYELDGNKYLLDDIDISVFDSEIAKLNNIIQIILDLGYKVRVCYYKNKIFQFKFTPLNKELHNIIDIKVYYDSKKDYYWSAKKKVRTTNLITRKLSRIIIDKWYYPSPSINIDKLPLSLIFTTLTWCLPKKLVFPLKYDYSKKIFLPNNVEGYLKHHFGDWKKKVDDWKSYRDDKALIHCTPEKFLKI